MTSKQSLMNRRRVIRPRLRRILVEAAARICVLACLPAVVAGCGKHGGEAAAPSPPAIVTVSRPLVREVTAYLESTGTTQAIASVDVRARVRGFLQSIKFAPRAWVEKDALLFVIDPEPFQVALDQARSQAEAARARLAFAEFEKKRYDELGENATERERAQALSERDAARAALASAEAAVAEAELNLKWAHVTAPISGRISRNLVDVGNLINAGENLLATITNDEYLYAYFNVSEQDVLRLRRRYGASPKPSTTTLPTTRPADRAPVFLGLMDEAGYPHEGWVDYVDTRLDPGTGTISIWALFPNAEKAIMPGFFARIRIPLGQPRPELTVTERAIGLDQGQRFLYVVNDRNIVEYRRVDAGLLQDGLRVIHEGIGRDDWVIVNGLQRVRPGATVEPHRVDMATTTAPTTQAGRPAGPAAAAATKPGH